MNLCIHLLSSSVGECSLIFVNLPVSVSKLVWSYRIYLVSTFDHFLMTSVFMIMSSQGNSYHLFSSSEAPNVKTFDNLESQFRGSSSLLSSVSVFRPGVMSMKSSSSLSCSIRFF